MPDDTTVLPDPKAVFRYCAKNEGVINSPSRQAHSHLTSVAPLASIQPTCVECGNAIEPHDETIPVAGGGELHDHCYPAWQESLELRGAQIEAGS